MPNSKNSEPSVKINGTDVERTHIAGLSVSQDLDKPDLAMITLNNTKTSSGVVYSKDTNLGDAVEVKIAPSDGDPVVIFKGEVIGVEAGYGVEDESTVCVIACNRLHRLTRGCKSRTFEKMSDNDIINKIAQDNGLQAQASSTVNIKHDHVYQANMTDFDFVNFRAQRLDYEVICDDTKLLFRKRDTSVDSGIEIVCGKDGAIAPYSMKKFLVRMNSAGQVQEVNVRAWNPDKHEEIVGSAKSLGNKMGTDDGGSKVQSPFGAAKYFEVGVPCYSKEEADAIAKAKLEELALGYITGEGTAKGHPALKAGIVVKIKANDERFDGKYYIVSATHRYTQRGGDAGGYNTSLRVKKNAEKGGGTTGGGAQSMGNT